MSKNTKTLYLDDDLKKKTGELNSQMNSNAKYNNEDAPRKEVEELLGLVKEIKMRRTHSYVPSFYRPPNKKDRFNMKIESLKENIEVTSQYNSLLQDNDFSIKKLKDIKTTNLSQEIYKKGFFVIYDQEREDDLDNQETSINLKKESLLQKILHCPSEEVIPNDERYFESLFVMNLIKLLSVNSRKLLLNNNNDKKLKTEFQKMAGFKSEVFFDNPIISNQIIMDLSTKILDLTDISKYDYCFNTGDNQEKDEQEVFFSNKKELNLSNMLKTKNSSLPQQNIISTNEINLNFQLKESHSNLLNSSHQTDEYKLFDKKKSLFNMESLGDISGLSGKNSFLNKNNSYNTSPLKDPSILIEEKKPKAVTLTNIKANNSLGALRSNKKSPSPNKNNTTKHTPTKKDDKLQSPVNNMNKTLISNNSPEKDRELDVITEATMFLKDFMFSNQKVPVEKRLELLSEIFRNNKFQGSEIKLSQEVKDTIILLIKEQMPKLSKARRDTVRQTVFAVENTHEISHAKSKNVDNSLRDSKYFSPNKINLFNDSGNLNTSEHLQDKTLLSATKNPFVSSGNAQGLIQLKNSSNSKKNLVNYGNETNIKVNESRNTGAGIIKNSNKPTEEKVRKSTYDTKKTYNDIPKQLIQKDNQKIIKYARPAIGDKPNKKASNKSIKFTPKKLESEKQNIWIGNLESYDASDEEWMNN